MLFFFFFFYSCTTREKVTTASSLTKENWHDAIVCVKGAAWYFKCQTPRKWFVDHCDVMLLCIGCLTAPQGPVRHWWDWLRGRLFLALAFGEDGKGRDSLERDGHWDIAQSCSVLGRSSGSHSLTFTSWSLKLTHSTCRVVFPWPQVTEHWKHTHTVEKKISHGYKCICSYASRCKQRHTNKDA